MSGGQSGTGNLDHGTDVVLHIRILFFLHLLSSFDNDILNVFKLFLLTYKRNHDLRNDVITTLFLHFDGSLHNGSCLHLCDLRISNSQTASTMAHHRVELMKLVAFRLNDFNGNAHILCKISHFLFCLRCELMKRRIQITNGHWSALKSLVHTLEIALLVRN